MGRADRRLLLLVLLLQAGTLLAVGLLLDPRFSDGGRSRTSAVLERVQRRLEAVEQRLQIEPDRPRGG